MPHPTYDRSPWLLEPGVSFLNHGSFGATPAPVLEAQKVWRERMEAEPVRFLDRELVPRLDEVRHEVARFLRADPEGLAFVSNATMGVSTVLASRRFEPGDELLAGDHEYNATINALRAAAERDGAVVRLVRVPFPIQEPSEAVEAYLEAVTPRTRFALVSHVTSPTALVLPIDAIVRELDRRGVDTLVDAAHAPGMVDVDLGRLAAAYWTANAHKWLCAPKGVGMLHVRADLRARVHPLVVSHGRNADRPDRSRFRLEFDWTGTGDPSGILSLPAALRYVGGLDDDGWTGVHGDQPLARATRPRPAVQRARRASRRRPTGCWARWRPCRCRASRRHAPRPSGCRPRSTTRTASRSRSWSSRCGPRSRPAAVRSRRSCASRRSGTTDQEEYAQLAESLARRLRGPASPRALLGRLRKT